MSVPGLPTGAAQALGFCPERTQHLVQVLQAEVDRQRLPGAVVLIARQGQVLLHTALGQQDPAQGTPMALDSIFRIYSMTKPLTSVAVMQLVEQGKLLLSDPVAQYLPEFSQVQLSVNGEVGDQAVLRPPHRLPTVHDLLRHTAGLTYEILGSEPLQRQYAQARMGKRDRSNAEFSQALAAIPLMFEPGSVWEYSRACDVLGALVEVISGQTLGAYLKDHILAPLGMADTGHWVPPAQQHRIAEPFAKDPITGAPVRLIDVRQPTPMEGGGSGMVSTAMDYARFLQCLLSGGALNGVRILAPSTVRYMTADHLGHIGVHRAGRPSELLPRGYGFGLGFAVRTEAGVAPVAGSKGLYYWGGIGGTTFFVDPQQDMFAVLMVQAPNQRDFYRPLFRNLVYAALAD